MSLKLAKQSFDQCNFKQALVYLKQVLSKDRTNFNALILSGKCLVKLGEHSQAETAYRRAAELNPDSPLSWRGLKELYTLTNNQAQLLEVLHQLESFCSDPTKQHELLLQQCTILHSMGQAAESLTLLDRLLSMDLSRDIRMEALLLKATLLEETEEEDFAKEFESAMEEVTKQQTSRHQKIMMKRKREASDKKSLVDRLEMQLRVAQKTKPDDVTMIEQELVDARVLLDEAKSVPEVSLKDMIDRAQKKKMKDLQRDRVINSRVLKVQQEMIELSGDDIRCPPVIVEKFLNLLVKGVFVESSKQHVRENLISSCLKIVSKFPEFNKARLVLLNSKLEGWNSDELCEIFKYSSVISKFSFEQPWSIISFLALSTNYFNFSTLSDNCLLKIWDTVKSQWSSEDVSFFLPIKLLIVFAQNLLDLDHFELFDDVISSAFSLLNLKSLAFGFDANSSEIYCQLMVVLINGRRKRYQFDVALQEAFELYHKFDNLDVSKIYATLLLELEQFDDAITVLQSIVDSDSCDWQSLSDLGWCYFLSGNLEQSLEFLSQSIKGSDSFTFLFRLGRCLFASDRTDEALRYFLQAAKKIKRMVMYSCI
ncbi:hypothetical protein GEMRC1_001276 [Eukaryota sp. GEM-RC1]